MLKRFAIGIVLVLLVTLPAEAREFQKGLGADMRGDHTAVLKELQPLAVRGDADAQYLLGGFYDYGKGVLQDYTEAAKWYRKAAEQGQAPAQFALGLLYRWGRGVPQDYVRAHMWFSLSAVKGDKEMTEIRDDLAKEMTPAQIAEAEKLAREWLARHRKK